MIPCISKEALKLLVGTADERYFLSADYFRSTHFPQVMRRFSRANTFHEVKEQELLEDLLQVTSEGNRVYAILGATGSGKSELLCWLKDQWERHETFRPVVRISRSELNPQVLIQRCYEQIGLEADVPLDANRWDVLVQKPITIVNQMIWTTLGEFFTTDEEIVPIALLMRPIIERNITDFSLQVRNGEIKKPLEVISRTQFQELITSTTLPVMIDFLPFRQSLLRKLDAFLFHGLDLLSMMKQLSRILLERKIRPLLLIDDLVQSVNLYASELLDHLITLEEGNWDVVIGLTPGALQDTEKGADLMHRLLKLDTMDDRIQKLWLTDETGQDFYSLKEDAVVPYMERYLTELKKTQGFSCSSQCEHALECSKWLVQQDDRLTLLPFNEHFLKRIYQGVPAGKGKLRYLLLHGKEFVRFLKNGKAKALSKVHGLAHRELYVEHEDVLVKTLAEWYADPVQEQVRIPNVLLDHFSLSVVPMNLQARRVLHTTWSAYERKQGIPQEETSDVSTVRDWIEGKRVNLELLEPVRTGVASLVHDAVKATTIVRPFTSRTAASIQRTEVEHRVRYPIDFEPAKSNKDGTIIIERNLRALDISGFQQLKAQERAFTFSTFAGDLEIADWIYHGELLQTVWQSEIERALGQSLEEFVFQYSEWVSRWCSIGEQAWAVNIRTPFHKRLAKQAEELFLDWFSLRDNMIDRTRMEELVWNPEFDVWFMNFRFPAELNKFQIHGIGFTTYFSQLQHASKEYRQEIGQVYDRALTEITELRPLILKTQAKRNEQLGYLVEHRRNKADLSLRLAEEMSDLDQWSRENGLHLKKQKCAELRELAMNGHRRFYELQTENKKILQNWGIAVEAEVPPVPDIWEEPALQSYLAFSQERNAAMECLLQFLKVLPQEIGARLLHQEPELVSLHPLFKQWTQFWPDLLVLLRGKSIPSTLIAKLEEWSAVDYSRLLELWQLMQVMESTLRNAIEQLQEDLGCGGQAITVEELIGEIKKQKRIGETTETLLTNLFRQGDEKVSATDWDPLKKELESYFPRFFQHLDLIVTIRVK